MHKLKGDGIDALHSFENCETNRGLTRDVLQFLQRMKSAADVSQRAAEISRSAI